MNLRTRGWKEILNTLRGRVWARMPGSARAGDEAPVQPALRDALLEVIHDMEANYQSGGREGGLHTGFRGFDHLTGGARPGELIVVGSVPGMGKTVLGLNIAAHVGLSGMGAVAFFSLESSRLELTQRLLCSQSGVSLNRVRSGGLSAVRDFPRLQRAAAHLAGADLLVDEVEQGDLGKLRDRLQALQQTRDVKLVVIDSLQLLCGAGAGEEEVGRVARDLKQWARDLGVVILVVAQLEAPPAEREGGRPALGDLGAARVVEQHADVVALLWRQDFFESLPGDYDPDFSQASLIVAKNRHGATGEVPLLFRKRVPRFENRALESQESWQV